VSHPAEMRIYFFLKLLIDLNVILHKNISFCRTELCIYIQYNYNHVCLNIKLHKKKGCVDKQILNSSTQFVMLFSTEDANKCRHHVMLISFSSRVDPGYLPQGKKSK